MGELTREKFAELVLSQMERWLAPGFEDARAVLGYDSYAAHLAERSRTDAATWEQLSEITAAWDTLPPALERWAADRPPRPRYRRRGAPGKRRDREIIKAALDDLVLAGFGKREACRLVDERLPLLDFEGVRSIQRGK